MGEHPKRRKDKYNPYRISENDGRYYILFKDGQEQINELEISRELYEAFNTFELEGARVIMLNITKTCCARMDFQILHFINSKVHIQPFC